ncbi:MAG TPA: hypothetical protein VFR86_23545 [Burkholderiaceae bacterium]|nr:hypothetical protein [Burkholderiaceae bacterium]
MGQLPPDAGKFLLRATVKSSEPTSGEAPKLMLARTIELDHEQSLILTAEAEARIKVIYGWVRVAGAYEFADCVLGSGEETAVRATRKSVIRSIGRTRIEVIEVKRSHGLQRLPEKIRRWLRLPIGSHAGDMDGAEC